MATNLTTIQRAAFRGLTAIQKLNIWSFGARRCLLRAGGIEISDTAVIAADVTFTPGSIKVGKNVFINRGCLIDGSGGITIGENVRLAFNVALVTSSHKMGESFRRAGALVREPVFIGDGAWIGAAALVMPGVSISQGVVVGAGSIVTKDLHKDALYLGTPASFVRSLEIS